VAQFGAGRAECIQNGVAPELAKRSRQVGEIGAYAGEVTSEVATVQMVVA